MTDSSIHAPLPWYAGASFRRWAIGLGVALLLVEGYIAVFKRENDFNWHLALGQKFLDRDTAGMADWYPIGRVALDGLAATMPYYTARGVFFVGAVAALAASLWFWCAIIAAHRPLDRRLIPPTVALACGLMLPFLLRDLDECGLQLLLLLMLSAGAYAMLRRRDGLAGFCLAAAVTYKATPLLFLPLLVWKRQWRAAGFMVAFLVVLNLLPAVYLGWNDTLAANRAFFARTAHSMANTPDAYPSVPGVEAPKPQNLSLAALLARYVETYEPGHELYMEHPAFVQFGNLPVDQAKGVVAAITLLLGGAIALHFRRSWNTPAGAPRFAHEWAVACLFCALLSPVCWKQHLVVGLPCVLLVEWHLMASPRMPRWRVAVVALAAAVWLLSRHGVVGREMSIVLLSYKTDTLALLAMAAMAVYPPRTSGGARHDDESAAAPPASRGNRRAA